jgi:hypothetical protein
MKKIILLFVFLGALSTGIYAQCNENLLVKAHKAIKPKETILNDFKVKLNPATTDQPAPVANFSQKFEKGKVYRLRILSDKEDMDGNAILRLFEGNTFLGTSYSEKLNKYFESFDFQCRKDGNYKLLVTFQEGKAGCAIVTVTCLTNL